MNAYKNWKINRDEDNIAWCHLDKAESNVNLLAGEVLDELSSILDDLSADLPKGLIILSDKKDSFIFGADIKEFTTLDDMNQAQEFLNRGHTLMDKLDAFPCTTVSMVHGICLGGGTELSLACDYIIATDEKSTRIGLPEIKLGIFPGYGGTVRSIKRCGPMAAMGIMLTGRTLTARAAKKIGLIDEMVPLRQLEHAAVSFIKNKPRHKKLGLIARLASTALLRPIVAGQMRKQVAKKAKKEHYPAPYALIDLWQQNVSDPRRMLKEEAKTVARLATSDTARNLVRVFFLQEQLKAQGKQVEFKPKHVHVIGGGIMGGDIASWCSIRGYSVTVQDQDPERLAQTLKRARVSFKKKFKRDRRSIRDAIDRLIPDHKGDGIASADIIIEAIFEDCEVKRSLYMNIEPRMKPDAILATNTSSIKLEDLSSSLQKPGRLVGLHFFNPVAMMPLIEVIRGNETDDDVMQQALAFARNIGKLPLPTKSSPGFLVNRILMPYILEAVVMVAEGIPAEVIDKAATDYGMPMGPIELADTVGLDICRSVAEILSVALGMQLPENLDKMVGAGQLGKKSGTGFYQYKNGKAIKDKNARHGNIVDVQNRLIMRLLNESMACLREGIVESKDFIDAGVIFGTGFAPFRGGPINYINEKGSAQLLDVINKLRTTYGERFCPDEGWSSMSNDK